jgi:hypothetical protein
MVYGTQEFAVRLKAIIKDNARHPFYEATVEHAKAMGIHINGDEPLYLLDRSRPREDEDVKAYRLENYEPTTKANADKAIDIVSKIFNPALYSIRWKDQSSEIEELQDYTLEYFPIYNSLTSFDKEVLLRKMIADPNAVMAVRPGRVPENDVERLKPINIIYSSCNVWDYDLEHFLIYISQEDIDGQTYYHFSYYDKTQYIFFKTWYEDNRKEIFFEEEDVYVHGFNEIPAWFLRGKSKSMDNGEIIFESYFSSALPHWNQAIIHESDLLGAYITHLHPQKYELAEECNFQYPYEGQSYPCRGGVVKYPDANGNKLGRTMDCPHCGGTGYSSVKSPYGTYQFSRQKLEEGQPSGLLPVGYITIPVEATKMLEERCEKLNNKGMWAINMDVEDKVGENQSGVAKVIDRSAQYDMLYTIGSVVFDIHLTNQFYFINKYMFQIQASSAGKSEDKNLPEISKPTMFDILTTSELINNFSVAQKAGVDKNYLRLKSIEIANRDLSTAPDARNYLVTMLNIDPLYGFTQDEISLGVAQGVIRKIDWTIHENLKPFMDKAIQADKDFLQKEKYEQLAVLEKYAKELISSEKPKVEMSVIDTQMQNVA